jgi:hypothetical protein
MQTIVSKSIQHALVSIKSDEDEINKMVCSNYELTPLLVCSSSELLNTNSVNAKSAITTIASTNCSSKSKTKGSGFKLNKNLFQNINSTDYLTNPIWKNIMNRKYHSTETINKSLAEEQKSRFDLKLKSSYPARTPNSNSITKNQDENTNDLYVTNGNTSNLNDNKIQFKSARRGSGAFKIKPNLKSELLKIQKQNRLSQTPTINNSINEVISITSTNNSPTTTNVGPFLSPDKMYTKLLAGKSSLNLKADLQRKIYLKEKTSIVKEPEILNENKTLSKSTNILTTPTRLPILLNKTNTQLLMPQKYLESLEVKKIAPVNKYNIYDFAEIFDSNGELFLDFENNKNVFLPDIQTLQALQNRKLINRRSDKYDLNLKFEHLCFDEFSDQIKYHKSNLNKKPNSKY